MCTNLPLASYIPLIAEIFSKESLPKIVEAGAQRHMMGHDRGRNRTMPHLAQIMQALDHRINNPETSHMDGEFLEAGLQVAFFGIHPSHASGLQGQTQPSGQASRLDDASYLVT